MSTERNSFTFYLSFEKAISRLSNKNQLLIYRAISRYSLFGEEIKLEGIPLTIWEIIKPTLDKSRIKSELGKKARGIEKPSLLGNCNAKKQSENKAKTKRDRDRDRDRDIKEIHTKVCTKKAPLSLLTPEEESFNLFQIWMKDNAPYCNKNLNPLTLQEFNKLKENYTGKEIADTIQQIENRKDLRKRYSNLYRTLLNWLKKGGTDNGK